MGKLIKIAHEGGDTVLTARLDSKKARLLREIILEIFVICSVYAPLHTNLWYCFAADNRPALGTFFNTVYFYIAVTVYALLAGKFWNIPCMIFMLLLCGGGLAGAFISDSAIIDVLELVILTPAWGLKFIGPLSEGRLYMFFAAILGAPALIIMIKKYFRT